MRLRFDYDREGLEITLPEENLLAVATPRLPQAAAKNPLLLQEALAKPLGSDSLAALARTRDSACVVVPDVTRPLPLPEILPGLLAAIEEGGIARERICILIATGLHRPNEGAELQAMFGTGILRRYRVENHYASDAGAHVDLGRTKGGVPVRVDRRLVAAGLKITLGLVEPHFMAGYSGGRKLVCPGVCAAETIRVFHGYRFLESEQARNCCLAGNPVHAASTEAAELAGVDFSVNLVMDGDRTVRGVYAGALNPSFQAACEAARKLSIFPIPRPADIVVVSGGGYPLDATWYQSIKGIVAAQQAVRRGGTIIAVAGLQEGVGSPGFGRLLAETESIESFLTALRTPGFYRAEQWQLQLFARVAQKARVRLFSPAVPAERVKAWLVEPLPSIEAGMAQAMMELGGHASILAMPHGPYVIPVPTP